MMSDSAGSIGHFAESGSYQFLLFMNDNEKIKHSQNLSAFFRVSESLTLGRSGSLTLGGSGSLTLGGCGSLTLGGSGS